MSFSENDSQQTDIQKPFVDAKKWRVTWSVRIAIVSIFVIDFKKGPLPPPSSPCPPLLYLQGFSHPSHHFRLHSGPRGQ